MAEMQMVINTGVGGVVVAPSVAARLGRITKAHVPDRRFKTYERDVRYFRLVSDIAFKRWLAGD
jgi:hypothetical protein